MRFDRAILTVLCVLTLAAFPCFAQPEAPPADEAVDAADAGEAAEVEPVLLRFDYEEGEKLTYETSVDGVGSVHVMGQAQAIDMNGSLQVLMTIEEIDEDGNYVVITDVDIAELAVTLGGEPVTPPQQEMTMRTTMTPRGEIHDLKMEQAVDQPNSETPWNSNITKMLTGGFDLN
ncbi:MAG: hypothetical protein GF393_00610, partial [Armatimonadia bacterium]|nr:hypothetical protein [Armatimonadia bacterium]